MVLPSATTQAASTWQAATQAVSSQSNDLCWGSSCPFHCINCSPTCSTLSLIAQWYVCLQMINSNDWAVALVISGCHSGWAERCAAARPSGRELGWEHTLPIQRQAKWLQCGLLHFCGERCRSGYRPRRQLLGRERVNQQDIHKLSFSCHVVDTTFLYWVSNFLTTSVICCLFTCVCVCGNVCEMYWI